MTKIEQNPLVAINNAREPAPVVRPLVEHLTERHAELKRLCWKLLDDMCNAYPEKSRTYWHSPNHQAIADFLHFK